MTSKIFLNGGGSNNDSRLLDLEFLKSLRGNKVLYIPIALKRDDLGFEICYDWITQTFSAISKDFVDIDMILNLKDIDQDNLLKYDAIYIGGGNTYKLLNEIRNSSFDKLIVKFLKMGKDYYGGSAGAILVGKSIDTAQFADKNEVKLKNTDGLNLIGDYSVWCHYQPLDDQKIESIIGNNIEKIIALTEKSGLLISNGEAKVICAGKVFCFSLNQKKVYLPGETFSLE